MSKLNAVNRMLRAADTAPVSSLEETTNLRARMAEDVLDQATQTLLGQGFIANAIKCMTLEPNEAGEIIPPADTLWLRQNNPYNRTAPRVALRDSKVFNVTDNSYLFTQPIIVDVIFNIPFEELSPAMQDYITEDATLIFVSDVKGARAVTDSMVERRTMARVFALREDINSKQTNMLTSSNSTYDIVGRRHNPRRRY